MFVWWQPWFPILIRPWPSTPGRGHHTWHSVQACVWWQLHALSRKFKRDHTDVGVNRTNLYLEFFLHSILHRPLILMCSVLMSGAIIQPTPACVKPKRGWSRYQERTVEKTRYVTNHVALTWKSLKMWIKGCVFNKWRSFGDRKETEEQTGLLLL